MFVVPSALGPSLENFTSSAPNVSFSDHLHFRKFGYIAKHHQVSSTMAPSKLIDLPELSITEPTNISGDDELRYQPNVQIPAKAMDWSDADAIRQVEYYFSDVNLPTDAHLLAKCGGHQNNPVSIKSICGFRKMRKYKPERRVVNALQHSTQLEVVDNKYVRRRHPLTLPLQVEPERKEVLRRELLSQHGVTRGSIKPTGFEEYYTDAPISPEVYAHERYIYDTNYAFSDRIERAVQRYAGKRKFHNDTRKIFNAWMKFGGIGERPRVAGQLSKEDLEDMTAEEIGEAMAVHWCHDDVSDGHKFVIDIEGVVMAFL